MNFKFHVYVTPSKEKINKNPAPIILHNSHFQGFPIFPFSIFSLTKWRNCKIPMYIKSFLNVSMEKIH